MEKGKASDARILKPDGSPASGSATESDLRDLRTVIAHLTEERNQYRTLAAIGTWHVECRPNRETAARELDKSQAVINKLADKIAALTEAHERLSEQVRQIVVYAGRCTFYGPSDALRDRIAKADALLSPREGTQLQEDQELTNDLTRRDTQTLPEGQPAASTDRGTP